MFKEKILDALKKKFEGVDEKVVERIASKLDKTTTKEEEVQTAVDGVTFQSIITSEADRRADEAQKTAVENYEKKHKLKDGKPVEKPQEKQNEKPVEKQDDVPAWAQALIDENRAMRADINAFKTERTSKSRRDRYEELFKTLGDKDAKERYLRDFDRLSFKDDDDFNGWLEERTPVIQKELESFEQGGSINHPPKGGAKTQPSGEVSEDVKSYLESAATAASQQQSFSSIAGLPGEGAAAQ